MVLEIGSTTALPPRPNLQGPGGHAERQQAVAPARSERASLSNQISLAQTESEPEVATARSVDLIAQKAASALFEPRAVETKAFHDEGSGRLVYRIADKKSGEVLMESPPDALLRFYASFRDIQDQPLVSVEA